MFPFPWFYLFRYTIAAAFSVILIACSNPIHVASGIEHSYDRQLASDIDKQNLETIYACAFDPSGHLLVVGGAERPHRDTRLELYDVDSGQRLRSFGGLKSSVSSVCFSADGKTVACCGELPVEPRHSRGFVWLWDVSSGAPLKKFEDYRATVGDVRISPDGTLLVTVDQRGQVVLRNLRTGERLEVNSQIPYLTTGDLESVEFAHDGRWIFTPFAQWPIISNSPPQVGKPSHVPANGVTADMRNTYSVSASRAPDDALEWWRATRAPRIAEFAFPSGKLIREWQLDCLQGRRLSFFRMAMCGIL